MKIKHKKIYLVIFVFIALVLSFVTYQVIDSNNLNKKIENTKQEIKNKELSDKELEYLLKKKYISDVEVSTLKDIISNVDDKKNKSKSDLNQLNNDLSNLEKIETDVSNKLTKNISERKKKSLKKLEKLKPITNKQKSDKEEYVKFIDSNETNQKLSDLIKNEIKIETYDNKITVLENKIDHTLQEQLLDEIPSIITEEEIAMIGISDPNIDYESNKVLSIKKFYPPVCALDEAEPFKVDTFALIDDTDYNDSLVDRTIEEYRYNSNYYLTMYNTKYRGFTTLTNRKSNKTYLIYTGSVSSRSSADCSEGAAGDAITLVVYDYVNKEIVSVTGTHSVHHFVLDDISLQFVLGDKSIYLS